MLDVIIVGAGPAGLSAALVLGRSRRYTLVCDSGQPRNASSRAVHNFLTRDGISPKEFRQIGREQLQPYANVELRATTVTEIKREGNFFAVKLSDNTIQTTRALLLATGMTDTLPPIEGFTKFFGAGVFFCPYCDGWEVRDQPLVVFGQGAAGEALALQLLQWSRDIVLCTSGPSQLDARELAFLAHNEIRVREDPIARVEGFDQQLERIVFADGSILPCRALFLQSRPQRRLELLEQLGIGLPERYQQPIAPGVYMAGDVYQTRWVSGAVADGVEIGILINKELQKEDLTRSYRVFKEE
ncbi:pyridine nucleotide-disulfide oxidoreductase [Dictyobacter alpinus]|uniref:Pyridine nucleotide-disulfide oxidoreductase n=1 Tax=Dictyobacter alpinus TaxID=2014873 RepID=A0A402BIL2_9CHLR|nr:NAD(P)/FAD-dependent oxidoreductase [Dictyobacter alpinus]GCE31072.1 pyridine nucleotide-disulfide oxidoreductase [Dictyobacter alpinus]